MMFPLYTVASINLEKSRYIELKEIEPVIAENNNDYVLKVKSLYDGLDD